MWAEFELGGYRMRPTIESTIEHIKEECNSDYGEVAIKAITKQIPMAVATHTIFNDYLQAWERIRVCPVCGVDTPVPRALETWEEWCPDCGQRLNWRDEE